MDAAFWVIWSAVFIGAMLLVPYIAVITYRWRVAQGLPPAAVKRSHAWYTFAGEVDFFVLLQLPGIHALMALGILPQQLPPLVAGALLAADVGLIIVGAIAAVIGVLTFPKR